MNILANRIYDFAMNQVTNLDAYCVNALEKDLEYLLGLDSDRLLAGFRETAGLDTRGAKRYAGWETTLIGGHTLGHYLSAVAQAYVNPGVNKTNQDKAYSIITYIIDGLLECQANSKGKENFVFGAVIVDPENVEKQFDNVELNRTNIITEAWVPWYTLHKLLAGVLDAYRFTKYEPALKLAEGIGDWSYERAMGWDEATAAQVLRVEYGGMNDALYELFSFTGKEKYAVVAHCFDSVELFERISAGGVDALNNHHANTTIPKFIGALNRYLTCHGRVIGGETVDASDYLKYAEKFWDMVVDKHTYVTGGNSEWEHFGRDYVLDKERTNCNCETCNIYNMLKYSRKLFCLSGDVKYADYYENGFINTILSSQNPETGMTTYFQPMSTGYFKVFGQPYDKFWCCTGTGMENFTKLNDSIFFHTDTEVIINLYESAELNWKDKMLKLTMTADLQATDEVTIRVETQDQQPTLAGLRLRMPAWLSGEAKIALDGKDLEVIKEDGYAQIPSGLANGSIVTLKLPMTMRAYSLPDNERSVAFKYGPTVLSAGLGTDDMVTTTTGMMVTIPADKLGGYDALVLPDTVAPDEFIKDPASFFEEDQPEGGKHTFRLSMNKLKFMPHYLRYKDRYGIYFNVSTREEIEEEKKAKALAQQNMPEGRTIDTVQPGYGQYENDELHRMYDWGGSVGSTDGGTSRYAKSGGSFTYHMCVDETRTNYLSLTFMKADNGKTMKIASGDEVFYEETLDYDGAEETYEVRVKIPEKVVGSATPVEANGESYMVIPLTFKGSQGAMSARLFGFVYVIAVER